MFRETQKFRQPWLWLIIMFIALGLLWPVYSHIITGAQPGKQPMPMWVSIILIITTLGGILLMYSARMDVEIDEEGITFSFFPLVGKKKMLWSQVENVYVREYNAILEYGGWGIRYSMGKRKGRALCVSGKMGIQIIGKDEKKLLLGTQKAQEASVILSKLAKQRIVKNVAE
ncbi:hypothetical protein [Taibaiella soli]|uniref:Bacterial Pleckstrin homology domain-containing protein n=1 Tax=Taibaiella soli TaxID=1649169 RepID=A0A2W2BBJ6_9BACT|nr:hypothetical protein [Taibaiella soli]PZF71016.1 hypothetical protein DN068_20140 [Taibaiella soli]